MVVEPGCEATLYRHEGFRGTAIRVTGDIADLRRTAIGNDSVSSLEVHCTRGYRRGWQDSYRDQDWRQGHNRRDSAWHDGGWGNRDEGWGNRDEGWRNRRSQNRYQRSNRVDRRARDRDVVLYRNANFRGRAVALSGDVADLDYTTIGNNELSSIFVPRGCRATLYSRTGFRGRAIEVRGGGIAHLGDTAIGNDCVSSIAVRCR